MKTTTLTTIVLALILSMSCSVVERAVDSSLKVKNSNYGLDGYFVSGERLGLYANLTKYNRAKDGRPVTKSLSDDVYCLDDLLDYTQKKAGVFRGKTFTQIPFKQNNDRLLACIHKSTGIVIDSCSLVKKYFISATTDKADIRDMYIVTMSPEANDINSANCDFLNKANYSGVC